MVGNLPNLITLTRILLLPFFAVAIIYREYEYALYIFIAASISDLLDGLIARLTNQITYLGTILDPVADKFFLVTSFILMSNSGLVPKWLMIIVISKDLIVVAGCIILYFVTGNLKVKPSILGKLSSGVQFVLIGLVLLSKNTSFVTVPFNLFYLVAIVTSLAGIHYAYSGLKAADTETEK